MSKSTKPQETRPSAKLAEPKKSDTELNEKELDNVSGGKSCASGQHIKDAKLTV